MRFRKVLFAFLVVLSFAAPINPVNAQSNTPKLPVYIVQPGDSLNLIALKFNVSAEDIIAVNGLTDPNILQVSTQLVIPGIEGAEGTLTFEALQLGETPLSIARLHEINLASLYKLNRITSPSEFFLGANIILVNQDESQTYRHLITYPDGEVPIETAIAHNQNPWDIIFDNQVTYPWQIVPEEQFIFTDQMAPTVPENFISIQHLPLKQGKTSSIIFSEENVEASATLDGMPIHFYSGAGQTSAIFGVHALKDPGLYPFHLEYQTSSGVQGVIDQLIMIQSGFYPNDPVLSVDPTTLDPAITQPEEDTVNKVVTTYTNEKLWDGLFQYPVDQPVCYKSTFGNRRSYNGEPYNRYHAGVDFGVCANLNVYAPANGVVVFTGPLSIRGNATIIDHGMGIFSGFWHQNKILVEVGQKVNAGDLIGEIGTTGRSTGPHLHWELVANGISVDPVDWLDISFP